MAATPTLDGYQILKYLGVASEHKIIDGIIIGLQYTYANESELNKAELVVEHLEYRCQTSANKLVANCEPEFYELAA